MATMYVRNEQGQFEKVGIGGVTTDASLSIVGKPADANAVGNALANCAPASLVSEYISYDKTSGLTDDEEIEADLEVKANNYIMNIFTAMAHQTTKRVCVNENGNIWFWDLFRGAEDFGCVMAYKYGAYGVPSVRSKNIYEGVIYPWAYQIPPNRVGIEYCTTELWNGKPVYTKMFNCGYLPGAKQSKSVELGISGIAESIVDMSLSIRGPGIDEETRENIIKQFVYPLHSDDSGLFQVTLYFNETKQKIRLYCLSDQSAKTGMLTVKYTKV